jgi:hypothetical protein
LGAIMRQIVTSVLMVVMCVGSMASVIWILSFSGLNLLLLAGECIAAVSTVVLAEEFVEWRSRTRGKVSEASPVKR